MSLCCVLIDLSICLICLIYRSIYLCCEGNPRNSYSGGEGGLVYDHLLHAGAGRVTSYRVPSLNTTSGHSLSNHEAVRAEYLVTVTSH